MHKPEPIPIAVIGMGCRFPGGASSPEALWSMLSEGRDAWSEVPDDRFDWKSFYHSSPDAQGCTNHRGGHFIQQDVAAFDANFFGISPLEAKTIDPQQRILLETTYEAVENAGIRLDELKGSDTAVFAATFANDYERMLSKDLSDVTRYHMIGTGNATFANRISHSFDLKGPSVTLDTGCSGSLVALHQACQSLRMFESSMALAGGAALILSPDQMIVMSQQHILNSEGRCFSFDSRGTGYGRGEGAAIIVLKRLSDALRAGDSIRAVVRNTCVNQDGHTNGMTLPSQLAQEELAQKAFQGLNFGPIDVDYIEGHGTGTPAGDGAELNAIKNVYCRPLRMKKLLVGSLKPNIGHLESASGVASVIKAILCLEKGFVTPNLLLEKPKKGLLLDQWNICVRSSLETWPSTSGPKRAVVNNFGYGGTNGIAVLESWGGCSSGEGAGSGYSAVLARSLTPASDTYPDPEPRYLPWNLFQFSAKSEASLVDCIRDVKIWLRGIVFPNLHDIAYTLSARRSVFHWRSAVVAHDVASLVRGLDDATRMPSPVPSSQIVFVFTGQGAQWPRMGHDLIQYPEYSMSLARSDRIICSLGAPWSLLEELSRDNSSRIHDSQIGQPASTALQIALVDLLRRWDIKPSSVIGHSSGEIAAAYAAGYIDHEAALRIAFFRGSLARKASQKFEVPGAMMAVSLPESEVLERIKSLDLSLHVVIACVNSPFSTTVSGDYYAVLKLKAVFDADNIVTRQLRVDTAYHSHYMEAVAEDYLLGLQDVSNNSGRPLVKFYSTVTGEEMRSKFTSEYVVANLVSKVRFSDAITRLYKDSKDVGHLNFVEIGPHKTLCAPVRQTLAGISTTGSPSWSCIPTLVRNDEGRKSLLNLAASLFEKGASPKLSHPHATRPEIRSPSLVTNLPSYHWDHTKRFWYEPRLSRNYRRRKNPPHDILGLRVLTSPDDEPTWRVFLSRDTLPWLEEHVIDGFIIFPATGYLSMVIEAVKQLNEDKFDIFNFSVRKVSFKRTLRIPECPDRAEVILNLRSTGSSWSDFRIFSTSGGLWQEHCQGQVKIPSKTCASMRSNNRDEENYFSSQESLKKLDKIKKQCHERIGRVALYDTLRSLGNEYGPIFSTIEEALVSKDQAFATIRIPDVAISMPANGMQSNTIHPAVFDSVLHIAVFLFLRQHRVKSAVPIYFQDVLVSPSIRNCAAAELIVTCELRHASVQSATVDVVVFQANELGELQPVITCSDGEIRALGEPNAVWSLDFKDTAFQMKWEIDPTSITAGYLEDLPHIVTLDSLSPEVKLNHLTFAANYFIHRAVQDLEHDGRRPIVGPCNRAFDWMFHHLQSLSSKATLDIRNVREGEIHRTLASLGVEGELIARIGPHLSSVLVGSSDALALLLQDDLLYRVYQDDCTTRCNEYLMKYLRHLTFKHPNLRILELGAGTGGTTIPLFHALSPDGKPFAARYDFTDISSGFFAQAQVHLKRWGKHISFQTLNIEENIVHQGFEQHSYDLVIASNILHATHKITRTLTNIHKLLKPGGRLAFIELTETSPIYSMTFGLLPGWWAGIEDGRTQSPLLSTQIWDKRLRQTLFTGLDITAYDFSGPARRAAFMTSRAKTKSEFNGYHTYQAKIWNTLGPNLFDHSFITELCGRLNKNGFEASCISNFDNQVDRDSSYIVLDSRRNPILANCDSDQFKKITFLVRKAANIFWITLHDSHTPTEDLGGGLVAGFARTARSEHEDLGFVTVDIQDDCSMNVEQIASIAANIICSSPKDEFDVRSAECEYMISGGKLHIPRLVANPKVDNVLSTPDDEVIPDMVPFHHPDRSLSLHVKSPGLLNSLQFMEMETFQPIGADEVEIEVHACGINFKDVWVALGQMKPKDSFVGECAGVVTAVGKSFIEKYNVGDRVCALTATPYASKARAHGDAVHRISDSISFVTAASNPVAFCTAYYSLVHVAKLEKDQRVLIHSASGALGQAAVQIAKHIGAEIFVTAGSASKRKLLIDEYGIPEDHIFSSRSTSFQFGILELTNGEGVDAALNFLSGDLLHSTWECIAELGTFVEVGKMEIRRNAHLDMGPFDKNITFSSVDMIVLTQRRPKLIQKILSKIFEWFHEGILRPILPVTIIPISEVERAFRMMQARKHTGKIILEAGPGAMVPMRVQPLRLQSDATYMIVGGLGSFGIQICHHLSERGAQHIIIVSRRDMNDDKRALIEQELASANTQIRVVCCDVSNLEKVRELASIIKDQLPPLKGIIHGPMVLRDQTLDQMTLEDFQATILPKYDGTRNVIQAFDTDDLDFFVMLSSLSGIVGLPGQANYAAGNTYQDYVANCNAMHGSKNFVSLDLAVLADTHMISKERQAKLLRRGLLSIPNEVALAYLDYAMSGKASADGNNQIVVGLNMQATSDDIKSLYSRNPMYGHVFASKGDKPGQTCGSTSKTAVAELMSGTIRSPEQYQLLITAAIREKISSLVAMNHDDISITTPIVNFGLDSLIAIELKNWITKILHVSMQTSDILDSSSITSLTALIMQRMEREPLRASDGAPHEKDQVPALIDVIPNFKWSHTNVEVPKLPLQPLENILDTFYDSISVFGNEEKLAATRRAIESFKQAGGVGQRLQARLTKLSDDENLDNWLYDIYNKSFWLQRRAPLRPAMNFFSTHALSRQPYSQAEKAALISLAAFEFKQKLDMGEISQDIVNDEPQCMESLKWIFNSYRRPGETCDTPLKYPGNDYIVAMRHGHVYTIPLMNGVEKASLPRLTAVLQMILRTAPEETCWASILTAENRTRWAHTRDMAVKVDQYNEEYFSTIEKALFVVCLDDGSPTTSQQRVQCFLLDNNSNRWNDKTLSFIVCENGVSAFWCEHSMIDGTTLDQLGQAITKATFQHSQRPDSGITIVEEGRDFFYYPFKSSPDMDAQITLARRHFKNSTHNIDFVVLELPHLGEQNLRKKRLASKGTIQAIISIAVRQHFGHNPASYEAVSLRSFRQGRLDIYQVHTTEMEAFCSAMVENPNNNSPTMRALLHEAVNAHTVGLANTVRGRGWDRQLTALRYVLGDGEEEPQLFQDPIFLRTRPRKVFVSFSNTGMPEWGSVWRDPEALWIGVEIYENSCKLCASNCLGRAKEFCKLVESAAWKVREIIDTD
ncbi:putative polyketide synthase [Zopfia rhizophila CBS 207.26]|uniref:Putative polyketide synthase n=1 Tax=Zopfia rhizophila CBS 207.26 TaxID=1314779 RepID=A0A6A6DRE1_9PEZI|nr:putative polyketide synthase [Zopfia rhizophila CBS 207.26]